MPAEEAAAESALPNDHSGRTRGAEAISGENPLTCPGPEATRARLQMQVPERNMPPADSTDMVLLCRSAGRPSLPQTLAVP